MGRKENDDYLHRIFPDASTESATFSKIPEEVKSYLLYEKDYFPDEDFNNLFYIRYQDGSSDIVAVLSRTEKVGRSAGTAIHVFNMNQSGKIIGKAHTFFNSSNQDNSIYSGHPYVSWTKTDEGEKRKGLAIRRLHILNHFCLKILGEPLRSSPSSKPQEAGAVWGKLYQQGLAEIVMNDESTVIYRLRD